MAKTKTLIVWGVMAHLAWAAAPIHAQPLQDARPTFMNGCQAQGNEAPVCACIFDNWSKDIPEDNHGNAAAAVEMFLGRAPKSNADMMRASTLLQDMTDVLFACASGAITLEEVSLPLIPQTNDAAEEAALLERITGPNSTVEEMSRYAFIVEARKAAERADAKRKRAETSERREKNQKALRADYEAELGRIHSRPIDEWAVADFEPLFMLYCQSGGGTIKSCGCAWPILSELSTYNAVAYFASRSEGDDLRDRVSSADASSVYFTHQIFNERRAICAP
jgi:hypothetical protein